MEFTFINTDIIKREISLATSVIEKKQTIPALQNLCLEPLSNTQLKVTSTDLDISISTSIEILSFAKKESGLINAKRLNDFLLNTETGKEIKITQLDNDWFEIKAGKSKQKIPGQKREDYPLIENHQLSKPIELPAIKFAELISKTIIAISSDEQQRFALEGSQLIIENDKIEMVATDGHRLALAGFPFSRKDEVSEAQEAEPIKTLIPRKCLLQLIRVLSSISDNKENLKIPDFYFSYSPNQLCFQLGSKTIYSKTLSGQFPNYNLVMPSSIKYTAKINTEEFTQALKRTLLIADEKTKGIKINLNDGCLQLGAKESTKGQADEELEIDYNEIRLDTGFNGAYVLDFLNKIDTKEFTLSFKDINTQGLFEPVNSNEVGYKYIVMPLRVDK